jgi:hypothetical protein
LFVQRRVSIVLFLLALFWVGEPAYALWKSAADHACCLPKPAAMPSCHGMAHDAGGTSIASHHQHADCPHDCCTKQRTPGAPALTARVTFQEFVRASTVAAHPRPQVRVTAIYAVSFERGPPTLS